MYLSVQSSGYWFKENMKSQQLIWKQLIHICQIELSSSTSLLNLRQDMLFMYIKKPYCWLAFPFSFLIEFQYNWMIFVKHQLLLCFIICLLIAYSLISNLLFFITLYIVCSKHSCISEAEYFINRYKDTWKLL